ncbi:hypothetical protein EOD42_23350 [Rhodovarius crocodyli]|uniref:Uncharacterized protein n=1 Tax=Rhodovarius crocodyli TaxID=1979269 RepID=A0A437LZ93_9PROT|nr:hypothetical protein [Rhodovarius crocodyli]RVT90741.1 hypothetical protein EOD42_23350 [Rhodovarius crocodyli]
MSETKTEQKAAHTPGLSPRGAILWGAVMQGRAKRDGDEALLRHMARLERDRSALLEALEGAVESLKQLCVDQHPDNVCCHHLCAALAAIASARGEG